MKAVRFTSSYSKYNVGEVASFEDAIADQIVAKKVAAPHTVAPEKQATPQVNKQQTGGERKQIEGSGAPGQNPQK